MSTNAERLWSRLTTLATKTEPDRPWTRRSFTPTFLDGRQWLAEQFEQAGLTVSIDTGGNLIGRLAGRDPSLPPILLGSHSDSVPSGGRFDGILGVIAALEVAQSLQECGEQLEHNLEVVDFLAEEPSEFGLSCIGSRALAGKLDDAMLAATRADGTTLGEALRGVGGDPDQLDAARRGPNSIAGFLELHIEQGKTLETRQLDIGVVTGIAAIRRTRVAVTGRADHAGQTPMHDRADALVGAARLIDGAYRAALAVSTPDMPLVATIGRVERIRPNAANAVPAYVELLLECRSADEAAVATFCDDLVTRLAPEFEQLGLTVDTEVVSHVPATPCANTVQQVIAETAQALGKSFCSLPSGAGHDGMFVSHLGPFGMIFVPCLDGRSHTPEEWLEPEQAAIGVEVMYETVKRLDRVL